MNYALSYLARWNYSETECYSNYGGISDRLKPPMNVGQQKETHLYVSSGIRSTFFIEARIFPAVDRPAAMESCPSSRNVNAA
jgi:hypothetical protein